MIRVTIHVEATDIDEQVSLDLLSVMREVMANVEADGVGAFCCGGLHKSIDDGSRVRAVLNATMNVCGVPQ